MSKPTWTPNQEKAIAARGMQVLVSAAAGSGKTAVLTERAKNIVTDTKNICKMSEILVVTFTRAAAGEMKERIYKALKEAEKNSENSEYISEQIAAIPLADICTIDSFSSKIVKDNFSKAGVSLDYSVLDEKELSEFKTTAVKEVIEELYEKNSPAFIRLTSMFLSERDDSALSEVILDLYNDSRSYPAPEKWLESVVESFSPLRTPNETVWAESIYKHLELYSDFHHQRLSRARDMIIETGGFTPVFIDKFTYSIDKLETLKKLVAARNWDDMVYHLRDGLYASFNTKNTNVDEYVKALVSDTYKSFKDDTDSLLESFSLPTNEEHKKDCEFLQPAVEVLCESVNSLENVLSEMKAERNAYSFDDILHKCITLLVEFTNEGWIRTPIALALQDKYKEIFIDEYQDTNQAQNIIFEAISRDCTNLYCVGDVKQSIYKFRLANPELFMKLRKRLNDYDGGAHPSQITLDFNFRSRKGITDVTNFAFNTLMSESVGEIDYNEREALAFGAKYYPVKSTPDVELLCLDYSEKKSAEVLLCEAEQVAHYIKKLLNSNITVTTKSGDKPLESSDICILLRTMKDRARVYADALRQLDIPANAVLDGDVSLSKEITLLISLFKIINNPLSDVELISVLFSPLFGFSADELSEVRLIDRNAEFYACLEEYSKTSAKAKNFMQKLSLYRNISASYPLNEFVRFVINDADISNIYLAADNGVARKSNIRGFIDFADKFTESGRSGLGAFCRSLDSAAANKKLTAYGGTSTPEGVQIMSVHKSKGLEFPYVIVANCFSEFNKSDAKNPLKITRATGIGLKIRDDKAFTSYNTVSSIATEKDILYSSASEELRVLYVAMTRAKEHITFVCSLKTRDGLKKNVRLNNYFGFTNGKLHPYAVYKSNSVCGWLLNCFSQHKDCQIICDICDIKAQKNFCTDFSMDVSPIVDIKNILPPVEEFSSFSPNKEVISELEKRVGYKYNFDCTGILAKKTASSTENKISGRDYFANKTPSFVHSDLTGALRGTAIHKFFELCDFNNAAKDPYKEKTVILNNGLMSERELETVDISAVRSFFDSSVGKRLLESKEIYKEYEFSFIMKAGEVYTDIPDDVKNEDIVIQGKLDCAFIENGEGILIDYKSDGITESQKYIDIYSPQLMLYARALEECAGVKVKEKYIYSFKLKKFIKV